MVETKGQKIQEHMSYVAISGAPTDNNSMYIDSADTFKLKLKNNAGASSEIGTGGGASGGVLVNATDTTLNTLSSFTLGSISAGSTLTDLHVEVVTGFDADTDLTIGTDDDPFVLPFLSVDTTGLFTRAKDIENDNELNTSLVAHWGLNVEGSVPDDSGNGHTGTATGAYYLGDGRLDGSYYFDGSTYRVTVPDSPDFSLDTGGGEKELSISLWMKPDTFPPTGSNFIIGKDGQSAGTREWYVHYVAAGLQFLIFDSSSNWIGRQTSGMTLSTSEDNHIMITYDASLSEVGIKIYVNNVLQTLIADNNGTYGGGYNGGEDVWIGSGQSGGTPNGLYEGSLYNIGMWSKELSSSERAKLYNFGAGRIHSGTPVQGRILDNAGAQDLKVFAPISWSASGSLSTARTQQGVSGTQAAGLAYGDGAFTTSTEEYNGTSWSAGGALATGRGRNAGFGTQTNSVTAGGHAGGPSLSSTEEYNGATWAGGGNLGTARQAAVGVGTLNAGYITGGEGSPINTTEEYNGTSWSAGTSFNTARQFHGMGGTQSAATLFGGLTAPITASVELWNDVSWAADQDLPSANRSQAAFGTANSTVSVAGNNSTGFIATTYLFNGTNWSGLPTTITSPTRNGGGGGSVTAGFFCGGRSSIANPSAVTENLDLETFSVTTGDLNIRYNAVGF